MNFKQKYKEELSDIRFSANFEENTVNLLMQADKRKDKIFMTNKSKIIKIAALTAAIIMALSLSAFAVISLLSSADVAEHFGDKELVSLFENTDFEPETITGEEYSVTFMGVAQGENFCTIDGVTTTQGRTYAVYAIYRNDGTAIEILDGNPINIIPAANGQEISTFLENGMSASCFVNDGVLYALYDYTDLYEFDGTQIFLMAFEAEYSPFTALSVNDNGEIIFAESYDGFKGKFTLNF